MPFDPDVSDFTRRDLSFLGRQKPVLTIGDRGPAVIVMHEAYGFTPEVARFCRWLRDAGLRVYAPILLGKPDASNPAEFGFWQILGLCISREFTMLAANKTSPVTVWLRELAKLAHEECGGAGVGAIGMCLTGGFALAMAVDDVMKAPVLSQPGMPARDKAALDIDPAGLARVKARVRDQGLVVRGYRFEGDPLSPPERFDTLRRELGDRFIGTELPDSCGNPQGLRAKGKKPHSVFTADLIDAKGERTREAVDEVIAFFREKLEIPA